MCVCVCVCVCISIVCQPEADSSVNAGVHTQVAHSNDQSRSQCDGKSNDFKGSF